MTSYTSRQLRGVNRFEVLHHVYTAGSATRQEIAADAGLSFATVASVVSELLEWGVLYESALEDSNGGRPRARLAIDPRAGALIGVDVAEIYVHVGLFDLALSERAEHTELLHPDENRPEDVVEHIAAGIAKVLAAGDTARSDVLGVGVSLPGQVDRAGGASVFAPNFSWRDVSIADPLGTRISLPIHVDNPLKASATAELWFGAGREARDIVVATIGTGVGAGFTIDGSLVRGRSNLAGEWGHSTVVVDGRRCRCGNRGCLEAYVGATGIIQQLRELDPASGLVETPEDQEATLLRLRQALEADDPTAHRVLGAVTRYLGIGIANLLDILDPEVVVLSGWVVDRIGDWLVPAARDAASRHAFGRTPSTAPIVTSTLRGNQISLGAAILALEGHLTELGVTARRR